MRLQGFWTVKKQHMKLFWLFTSRHCFGFPHDFFPLHPLHLPWPPAGRSWWGRFSPPLSPPPPLRAFPFAGSSLSFSSLFGFKTLKEWTLILGCGILLLSWLFYLIFGKTIRLRYYLLFIVLKFQTFRFLFGCKFLGCYQTVNVTALARLDKILLFWKLNACKLSLKYFLKVQTSLVSQNKKTI